MCRVWRIGSTYGSQGSILDVFWKYQVVFAGTDQQRILNEVSPGHLFAIADGLTVVGIGKVISPPGPIDRFGFEDSDRANFAGAVGARVRLVLLDEGDRFAYRRWEAFFEARSITQKVINLDKEYNSRFGIEAETRCLGFLRNEEKLNTEGKSSPAPLLDGGTSHYVVPIYQRPYSWTEPEVSAFLSSLFQGFFEDEPTFIGPMQLSFPIPLDTQGRRHIHEVIDGQQRLATLLLLLKILRDRDSDKVPDVGEMGWLQSRVNNGQQQKLLDEALALNANDLDGETSSDTNPFISNLRIIRSLWDSEDADIEGFLSYLSEKVLFVCMETRAGLSKTLQIFNTLNTAGMDLGGTDLFKLKFYEYLCRCNRGEEQFERISQLYETIERRNHEAGMTITTMDEILDLFKYVVIARSSCRAHLFKVGKDTFFERLFDTILGANDWSSQGYSKEGTQHVLTVEVLQRLIDARYRFHELLQDVSAEAQICHRLVTQSRYGRYHLLGTLLLMSDVPEADRQLERFIIAAAKLFIAFSCSHGKQLNAVNNLIVDIVLPRLLSDADFEAAMAALWDALSWEDAPSRFNDCITRYLAWNPKAKGLVCRLSAMLEEEPDSRGRLMELLFDQPIDIEHIEPCNNEDRTQREDIWKEWGDTLHSIGNLVAWEAHLNRSNGNRPHEAKCKDYAKSKLSIVKAIPQTWSRGQCEERRDSEADKLTTYLFGPEDKGVAPTAN